MIKISDKVKCSGCHACMMSCPVQCITMQPDKEGFLYPKVDIAKCVDCGLCEKKCPISTPMNTTRNQTDILAYAAYSKNEVLRNKSSSGGVFTEIAQYVLQKNGVVFGAAFDNTFCLKHILVDSIDALEKLRGSKYVQSEIGTTFQQAMKLLDSGRIVLFTGTPCQIAGLYSFIGKEHDNLITLDIVCHGVPSPLVWRKYKKSLEKRMGSNIVGVNFRDKKTGWRTYSFVLEFLNKKFHIEKSGTNSYMQFFLKNLSLRPSCYHCAFKGTIRQSDFTLGDFWGIENVLPEMDDGKGTSLLLVNSSKGQKVLQEISKNIYYQQVNVEEAVPYNASIIKSPEMPKNRTHFMKELSNDEYEKIARKYNKRKFFFYIKLMMKKIVKHIKK